MKTELLLPPAPPANSPWPPRESRYRIVTNGTVFRVQRRTWIFWRDCKELPWGSLDHDTIDQARNHLRHLTRDDARRLSLWTVVR